MEPSEVSRQAPTRASTGYSTTEYSSDQYTTYSQQLGERPEPGEGQIQDYSTSPSSSDLSLSPPLSPSLIPSLIPSLAPSLAPSYGTAGFKRSKKELKDKKRQERKGRLEKARNLDLNDSDYTDFKEAVNDWFNNKRPSQFPGVLFNLLDKLSEVRKKWLQANPDQIPEVLVEAWVSPEPNEAPTYLNTSGIGLWKWLYTAHASKPTKGARDNKFILISLTGLTSDVMKALLIHYDIKVKTFYEIIYVDNFMANLHPPSENVFALSFDFVRLIALGEERLSHTQTFTKLENTRRNHILSWKWDPLGSEPEDGDRAFGIARAAVWINRDRQTGKTTAIFYTEPKKSKKMRIDTVAQWNMSRFCDDPRLRTRSSFPTAELGNGEPPEEIFEFLARYMKQAFKWSSVLSLHHQRISALEEEAFGTPMLETTRDLYRQKSALDIHLSLLSLQKTMISALRTRQVSESMFWPQNAVLLFGDIEDGLGEKIIEFERMRKQCDDIHNLICNIISIEESRAAVDQGRSVGRLTWLTFIFLPLSFGASILGMNVFQLNSPSLWVYFALTIPLFILVTGGILVLKASVLYSQSGQNEQMGFAQWLISGRPMRSQLNRTDLERGILSHKLSARLGNKRGRGEGKQSQTREQREQREPVNDKLDKED